MKNIGTIIAALVLALVLGLYMCSFQVRFTEVAIVKTWGKPAGEAIKEPGLYWKWPEPVQSVQKYDGRLRIMEDKTEETRTVDGKNLVITTYALWRIADPAKFNQSVPQGEEEGRRKLRTVIVTHKHAVVGKHGLDEFISTEPGKRRLRDVENEMLQLVARDAMNEYGMEVVGFGIKKLALPTATTSTIFQSMRANEEKKSRKYETEGEARFNDIVASARAAEARILAAVDRKVNDIKNEARQEEGRLYESFAEYPELRIYLDKLRAIRDGLRDRSTIILDTEKPPFDVANPQSRERVAGQGAAEEGDEPQAEAPAPRNDAASADGGGGSSR